jgi:hypothetical protein
MGEVKVLVPEVLKIQIQKEATSLKNY